MTYEVEIRAKAQRDLISIPQADAKRISRRIVALANNLAGDVNA